jgi:acetyl/propionyl-CoA carboxylase alpha subunit
MRMLGSKIDAKQLAVQQGVPITPGFFEPGASAELLYEAAHKIGYPIMLKASAGGGGRGMRVVREESQFFAEYESARQEAEKAFGDGAMMVEKLVDQPRHIEVQAIADSHGNVACLFERECSIQRRHQKLIEEAPSPIPSYGAELWPAMRSSAEKLLRASGYVGAGTIEFMVDPRSHEFYFLEVNARLQVEHPVTEAITGLDLVRLQIEVASGAPLAVSEALLRGDRSALQGHAFEARIVAEDPGSGFLPSLGKIIGWAEPTGPGVRIDTGFGLQSEISRHYDSLIAKVIVHGATRTEAIARLRSALLDFHILGLKTNICYLLDVIDHPEFQGGSIDTGFLTRNMADWQPSLPLAGIYEILDAASSPLASSERSVQPRVWDLVDGFRIIKPE